MVYISLIQTELSLINKSSTGFMSLTMTGKTMAATVDLRIQSRAKQRTWMKVKR